MNKLEFISRQFAKAENKKFEHYVVTRIWHLLDDLNIKVVTQQFVSRPNGRAITDMYFPQIAIHIEVDEGFHKKQIDADKLREADIINATYHEIFRVDVTNDIGQIHIEIDKIVKIIKKKIENSTDFKPWDLDKEQNPQTYIDKGYLDISEDVAFKTIADAASCFGRDYSKGLQKAYIPHPTEPNKYLWLPKLYDNDKWVNSISADEEAITEFSKDPENFHEHIDRHIEDSKRVHSRIVFARVKSSLGDLMYRFKGEYKLDCDLSNYENGLVYKRISNRVKTYPNKK